MAWNRVLADFKGDRYKIRGGAWPRDAVDPAYINRRWIPLTHDGSGNHIGLDFDPWPAGRIGQVILYGRDQDVKAVIAPSLGKFLGWVAGLLESGNFRLQPQANVLREFRLKTPEAGRLRRRRPQAAWGARTLLVGRAGLSGTARSAAARSTRQARRAVRRGQRTAITAAARRSAQQPTTPPTPRNAHDRGRMRSHRHRRRDREQNQDDLAMPEVMLFEAALGLLLHAGKIARLTNT